MIRKTTLLLALLLILCAALPAQAEDAAGIRGYSRSAGYEYVTFGAYPTDADGAARPIVWRVLKNENGEAYLLSEYILFSAPVHGDYEHYSGWAASDLYNYLNGVFLNDAFSAEEQTVLLQRTEDGALVTLITSDEMKDASIGFSSNTARLCESTEWAKVLPDPPIFELPASNNKGKWKPLYIYSKGRKYSPWWSRTQSTDYPHEQRRVMDEGKIGRISTGNSDLGVRPAVYVNLNLMRIQGGNGALASPYELAVGREEPLPQVTIAELEAANPQPESDETPVDELPAVISATAEPEPAQALPDDIPVVILADLGLDAGQTPADEGVPAGEEPAGETETETAEEPAPEIAEAPAAEPAAAPAADAKQGFTAAADPAGIHERFPALTAEGFLPEGEPEFVYQDGSSGLWLYCSQTLRIEINRRTGTNTKKQPLRWYEAKIYTRDESERFDFFPYDANHYTSYGERYKNYADNIALQHKVVFAVNSDYFIYRVERDHEESYDYPIGVIVRDGEVLFDRPKKATSTVYPPLDVMALYPDGSISLHRNATVTSKDLLAAGATDALSFGPILVENGKVSPRSKEFGSTPNPRTAWGMVEPGYYIAVVVESRTSESKGESCVWLGEKMAELGCASAINLDGGATSVMMFMGHQINKSGNYGDITNRKQNELFGIGHSDNIF